MHKFVAKLHAQEMLKSLQCRDETKNSLLEIFVILKEFSQENYLVGGCVRDSLLGIKCKDYDIVTDVPISESSKAFQEAGWTINEAGTNFLVLIISKHGQMFEIANFRKDGVYLDGRRPDDVEIGTMEEDARRRDFTVNALYQNPFTGRILDPTRNGNPDLCTRTLRFIGKPKDRIKEDYLRVFRFYRFLSKGFTPDMKSLRACREMFNVAYEETTPERARMEIERMVGL